MNEQFEFLPLNAEFGAAPQREWEWEWEMEGEQEGERGFGGRGGGRGGGARGGFGGGGRGLGAGAGGRGAQAGPRNRPISRMQPVKRGWSQLARHNWPRRRPPGYGYGPYYSGWPYAVLPLEPEPYPVAFPVEPFPAQGPAPAPGNGGAQGNGNDDGAGPDGAADDQGEVPPTLGDTLARLPAAQRPAYQALGPIQAAMNAPQVVGPGLYLIEFTSNGRRRAYSGQSDDIRRRLQQHLLCAQMMGLSLAGHQVYVAPLPSLGEPQRRALEKRIHRDMFARHAGVLTNQRAELEMEWPGAGW